MPYGFLRLSTSSSYFARDKSNDTCFDNKGYNELDVYTCTAQQNMLKYIFGAAFLLSSCGGDGLSLAEAFATMSPSELSRFIASKESVDIANYRFGRNQNVVHAAINNKNSANAISLAFENGSDLDHLDNDRRTPLHHAIDANLLEATQTLLALGASTSIENEAGFSPTDFCELVLRSDPMHAACRTVLSP
ncbi:ankyrin repeat domain-containing protein [Marivita hallyeonensis]|uniref:Ankyrin repeat-containing protein n=1 Tax=Marivita hallyeonensis TaxID=996342 RepID=A0A1M5W0N2_9RHOB|nr:ankyrin repeat domain-containing protein [Marivita hallyeonensis]SHH80988.1 Ankyrin repeat-containing protein [Marivita hallyeonensis]